MNYDVGDRVETVGIEDAPAWLGRRGTIQALDYDLVSVPGKPEAVIVLMDRAPGCPGCQGDYGKKFPKDGPCLHRFVFKYLRKLSILELLAEAASCTT